MIPKIIHYCWFGGNPIPEIAKKCIDSWKTFLPDYEIKEWNESNYDVRKNLYIEQAYNAKKYAFVSDFARFDILYKYGGVYFDTDVEVIKDFQEIIDKGSFLGIEKGNVPLIAAGLGMASPAGNSIYREILESYQNDTFINTDGSLNLKTVVVRVTDIFKQYGYREQDVLQNVADTIIYPSDYFCPKNYLTGYLEITSNTYSIHHYDASWVSSKGKKYMNKRYSLLNRCGENLFTKLLLFPHFLYWKISDYGLIGVIKKILKKITCMNIK